MSRLTSTNTEMERLQSAATARDERAFTELAQSLDWSQRPPEAFLEAVRLALSTGAHMAARHVAQLGARRFPQHAELKRYAQVLAPPRLVRRGLPARPDLYANREWMRQHANEYRRQWVALRKGQLLATAESFEALAGQFPERAGILLTRLF